MIHTYYKKTYFAKHFPTAGEIKRGTSKVFDSKGMLQMLSTDVQLSLLPDLNKTHTPAKLFLCSRNVEIGDTIFGYRDGGWDTYHEGICSDIKATCPYINDIRLYKGYGKIVGQISDKAIWIKDNDEFDEKDLCFLTTGPIFIDIPFDKKILKDRELFDSGTWIFGIKGQCGHFH